MIWLLRHGDAEDSSPAGDDASRELTDKGRRQSTAAGSALSALGVRLDACLASPKIRAMETARLACDPLAIQVEADERLAGGDFDPLDLAAGRGEVMLVGHEPDFSRAIAAITGANVKLKKGGLAAIEDGQLQALLRPADLKRIAGG
jgi:phosphohistidine phosphatase